MSLERGLSNLVHAMAHVPAFIHLVLMGYGDEAKQVLTDIAQTEGISHRIHFKETVSHQDLLFWTASADAGIIPYPPVDLNNYYCSPGKLFEFIQAKLPIIANDLPFLRQIVAEEEFGVVMPLTDADSFAQAIRVMFDQEAGGPRRFKKNLLEKATKYSWQVEETKLLELYGNLNFNGPSEKAGL
jgi:glycosyltransferase involved in cell wall biosynthesis